MTQPEHISKSLARVLAAIQPVASEWATGELQASYYLALTGLAVNASFARRKGGGPAMRPDFRAQLTDPPAFDFDHLLNPPSG